MMSLSIAGCSKSNSNETAQKKGPAETIVDIMVLQPEDIDNNIITTGTLLSNEEVDIQSEISGRVVQITFREGSQVAKGQLLIKLYDKDLKAQLKKNEILEKQAKSEADRKRELIKIKAVSAEELDKAVSTLETIQADKELLKAQIEKTEIRAPFSGVIGLKQISEGGYVTPNAKIANIQQLDPIKIEFTVPERYAGQLKIGSDISFTINSKKYTAKVYALDSRINNEDRTLKVRAHCSNGKKEFIPGTFAKIDIMFDKIKDAILVPAQAIVPDLNKMKVFVLRDGKAKSITVQTGIRNEKQVEITEGLQAGDTLITTGLMQIKNNRKVKIGQIRNKKQ